MCIKNNHNTRTLAVYMVLFLHIHPLQAAETALLNPAAGDASQTVSQADIVDPQAAGSVQANENSTAQNANDAEAETLSDKEVSRFDILEFRVNGNTKLTSEQIEAAVYPHMGEAKSIADVNKARDALEKAYHEAGYLTVLVDIPEQEVNTKVVLLNVTEGKVGRLRVKDSHYFTLGRIKALAPSVKEGEVPHFPTVQQDIAKLNRTTDKRVTPVMKAGKTFGTVDVELKVEDNLPLHASLELNDRYSRDTSHLRLAGMIRYDNLWQREHSLSLNFLTSPEDTSQVKVISANYLARFDATDLLLALYAVRSKSSVATVGGINILGNGSIYGVRLIKPLPSLANYYHSISFGLDYKDFGQTVVFGNSFDTPVKYAPFSASYSGTWQEPKATTQLSTGVTFGLRGFVSDETEFANKRVGASPDFFIAKADLQRTQGLPKGFEGFARIDGQFSGDPLISNEQYLAGGADTIRGYLEAEAAGDQAVHTTLELRTPSLFSTLPWLQDFKLTAFYDAAQIRTVDAFAGQPKKSILAGSGLGFRMKAWKRFNTSVDLAWAMKDSEVTQKGDFASHMRIWYEF